MAWAGLVAVKAAISTGPTGLGSHRVWTRYYEPGRAAQRPHARGGSKGYRAGMMTRRLARPFSPTPSQKTQHCSAVPPQTPGVSSTLHRKLQPRLASLHGPCFGPRSTLFQDRSKLHFSNLVPRCSRPPLNLDPGYLGPSTAWRCSRGSAGKLAPP